MANLKYWLWFSSLKGVSDAWKLHVLNQLGSPETVYFADQSELMLVPGLPENALEAFRRKSLDDANRILGNCDRLGIQIKTMQDSNYPERLAAIANPPFVLYYRGKPPALDEEVAVGIVGTRTATPYGKQVARQLAMDLTRKGALVVTGMAEGIDSAAIEGALSVGGPVVSVVAGGLDIVYPKSSRGFYEDVAVVGTLMSERPPGTEHLAAYFPIRNRIISGLSLGIITVESKRFGGSLHTVGHALDQNRDVFAVPGPVGSPESEGTNRLIQEGAKLILNADDVLCEYEDRFPSKLHQAEPMSVDAAHQRLERFSKEEEKREPPKKESEPRREPEAVLLWSDCRDKLTEDQQKVLVAFDGKSLRVDDLVELTQIPARRVLSALTILQIQGYVKEESGKRFRTILKLQME